MGDNALPIFMKDVRPVRYNLIQLGAGLVTSKELSVGWHSLWYQTRRQDRVRREREYAQDLPPRTYR